MKAVPDCRGKTVKTILGQQAAGVDLAPSCHGDQAHHLFLALLQGGNPTLQIAIERYRSLFYGLIKSP
ncbi:MAG: hypothetical protein HQL45_16260 [Alphaproteobacteria bacterium]|nr:hypothetical protein [Alphaproteobacteria bacterium]